MIKTLVGLSGGVDSALVAAMLLRKGHDVIAATMRITEAGDSGRVSGRGCLDCKSADDIDAPAKLAASMGIKHITIDCADKFRQFVMDDFRAQYMAGRTPNPCVRCNYMMKFGLLPAAARDVGIEFDFFATGHYARITDDFRLRQAADKARDQSYFLYRLTRQQLQQTLFPLGELTKQQVRRMAGDYGLWVADQPDSQDFYSGDYADLLDAPSARGDIVTTDGATIGHHDGFWRYTMGQRKGLGVSAGRPLYVVAIKPEQNQVIVGFEPPLSQGCYVVDMVGDFEAGKKLWIKVRSTATSVSGMVDMDGRVMFEEPQLAVPGQSLVAYDGDIVIAGGIIEKTFPA